MRESIFLLQTYLYCLEFSGSAWRFKYLGMCVRRGTSVTRLSNMNPNPNIKKLFQHIQWQHHPVLTAGPYCRFKFFWRLPDTPPQQALGLRKKLHAHRKMGTMEPDQNSAVGPKHLWEVEYRCCLPVPMQENALLVLLQPPLSHVYGVAQCTNGFRRGDFREIASPGTCKTGWNFKTCSCPAGESIALSFHTMGNTTTDLLGKVLTEEALRTSSCACRLHPCNRTGKAWAALAAPFNPCWS